MVRGCESVVEQVRSLDRLRWSPDLYWSHDGFRDGEQERGISKFLDGEGDE